MQYLDHRLSKILGDIRIEQASSLRQRRQGPPQPARQRLGLWLIEKGESLARQEPRASLRPGGT